MLENTFSNHRKCHITSQRAIFSQETVGIVLILIMKLELLLIPFFVLPNKVPDSPESKHAVPKPDPPKSKSHVQPDSRGAKTTNVPTTRNRGRSVYRYRHRERVLWRFQVFLRPAWVLL